MALELLIKGFLVGLLVSVPLGPIGVLVIQRTANKSFSSGMFSGAGASLSDGIFAIVAGFSLTYIIDFIRNYQMQFQLLGAAVVLFLGFHIFFSNPISQMKDNRKRGATHVQDFLSTFFINLTNPLVIFVFLAVFASSGIVFSINDILDALMVVGGVLIGSSAWWITLSFSVYSFKHRLNLRVLWWLNKISGSIIIISVIFGIVMIIIKGNPKI